jgi:deazaflavin-dependent oxidoreductase (nitroreductase family)
MPVWLFRLGLGGFFPGWILLVTTGRKSGQPRYAVVDIVRREGAAAYVLAGYGEVADWVKNLRVRPDFTAQIGWRRFAAQAAFLPTTEAADLMVAFYQAHPTYARATLRLVGLTATDDAALRRLAETLCVVRIAPCAR